MRNDASARAWWSEYHGSGLLLRFATEILWPILDMATHSCRSDWTHSLATAASSRELTESFTHPIAEKALTVLPFKPYFS